MKTNAYVKYMTEEVIKYMNTPREERREHKQVKKELKTPFVQRLFGMIPFGFAMLFKRDEHK
ncbi:YqzE family protein [Bacillus sp. NPDC077027]|uniref:YqzE family protein n=1 Tax=Bacillus sp. NPDC077027 TaxID=3390548 RepID=UPI003D0396AE